jgi:hypothetical protein
MIDLLAAAAATQGQANNDAILTAIYASWVLLALSELYGSYATSY